MRLRTFLLMVFLVSLFTYIMFGLAVTSHAALSETSFKSIHQSKGLKAAWSPGASVLRVTLTKPTAKEIKLFVPPGTISINLTAFVSQGNNLKYKFIARYGSPPELNTVPAGTFSNDGFKLSALGKDCVGENSSGYLRIAIDGGLSVTEGKWLYVVIKQADGVISSISGVITVDKAKYTSWYNSALFGKDGDPLVSATLPTPAPTPTSVITPTPKPTPIHTPVASCNELMCILSGGRCVNGACVPLALIPTPVPTPVTAIDIYQGSISGMPITIELVRKTDITGIASIRVGEKTVPDLAYQIWEHGKIKTIYVVGLGYLDIVGNVLKVNTFSGISLEKKEEGK